MPEHKEFNLTLLELRSCTKQETLKFSHRNLLQINVNLVATLRRSLFKQALKSDYK